MRRPWRREWLEIHQRPSAFKARALASVGAAESARVEAEGSNQALSGLRQSGDRTRKLFKDPPERPPWGPRERFTPRLLLGCFSSGGSGDCTTMEDGVQREECLFQAGALPRRSGHSVRLHSEDRSPSSQDLLRLRLAVGINENQWLCDEVTTRSAQDRCRQVVGQPRPAEEAGGPAMIGLLLMWACGGDAPG